jgi:hypothetical protein
MTSATFYVMGFALEGFGLLALILRDRKGTRLVGLGLIAGGWVLQLVGALIRT